MDSDLTRLTVFFEAPFWVGVFERFEGGTLSVCKVTFGAEPKDYDVFSYVLKNYARLRFSPAVAAAVRQDAANPKRMQREIRRASSGCGVGTKAQQALQLQREEQDGNGTPPLCPTAIAPLFMEGAYCAAASCEEILNYLQKCCNSEKIR